MIKRFLVLAFVIAFVAGASLLAPGEKPDPALLFHTDAEREAFRQANYNVLGPGDYFLTSAHCKGCHGLDSAGMANIDEDGNSVNLFDHWESSMMAQSARDPLWR